MFEGLPSCLFDLFELFYHSVFRQKVAAIKIQSAYRGYRIRKQFHIFLRSLFDKGAPTQSVILLETQISRLAFFFRPDIDCERTVSSLNLVPFLCGGVFIIII